MGVFKSQEERLFDFQEEAETPPDTLAIALSAAARRAFSRGLLHGYRTEEEALHTVRGRIRFADQIRQRFGIPLPIEVRYDEFTDDITENQLVKAAAIRLGGMRLRSQQARRNLGWIAAMLENVSSVESFPKEVPDVRFDRINEHYRGVVGLSRLILRHSAFESERGTARAAGFLMDMNTLLQEFLTVALRETSGSVTEQCVPSRRTSTLSMWMAEVKLRPDLTWWHGRDCQFVGDAKYTSASRMRVCPTPTCINCSPTSPRSICRVDCWSTRKARRRRRHSSVRHSDKRLEVAALNLGWLIRFAVLKRVDVLAERVKALRDEAIALDRAA